MATVLLVAGLHAITLITPRYAMGRQIGSCPMSSSNALSCGEVCITGFGDPACNMAVAYAKIEDTVGIIMPLNWTTNTTDLAQINSISYQGPTTTNTHGCNATQFLFYNELGKRAGFAYLTPGQAGHGCVDFGKETVVSYHGVNMYINIPESYSSVDHKGGIVGRGDTSARS